MNESRTRTCGKCLLPIHPSESGIRHYGTHTAHSEARCIALLHQELAGLESDLAAARQDIGLLKQVIENKTALLMQCEESLNARNVNLAVVRAERDEALEALREYHESHTAPYPPYSAGKEAQDAWIDRIDKAEDRARAILAKAKP